MTFKAWFITVTRAARADSSGRRNTSIRYTERLAEAGVRPSIGSVGDSYDNALAESIIGLFKTELFRRRGALARARRGRDGHTRMGRLVQQPTTTLSAIGNIPRAEAETNHYLTILLQIGGANIGARIALCGRCLPC